MTVIELTEDEQINQVFKSPDAIGVLNFWASWAEPCKHMNTVFKELASQNPGLVFISLEAERVPEISENYEIESVPTFVFVKGASVLDRVDGANAPQLTSLVSKYAKSVVPLAVPANPKSVEHDVPSDLNTKLRNLINRSRVVLFMKGTPEAPRCGFSRKTVELLDSLKVPYSTFDILSDEDVRQGLKDFSKWPTYPQIYISGELLGGLDILKEMIDNGEFQTLIKDAEPMSQEARLKQLINRASVMIFMKGNPTTPRCGFSRQLVELLQEQNVEFDYFDILEDEDVRQGLKVYSNWPTYPQVYVKGELIGGLDIVKELIISGEFASQLAV
ncbi:glutaredoxin 3 [Cladochytrium replicatum]|nr:glutaredoxin 3 [Cladochytrium replicatum]